MSAAAEAPSTQCGFVDERARGRGSHAGRRPGPRGVRRQRTRSRRTCPVDPGRSRRPTDGPASCTRTCASADPAGAAQLEDLRAHYSTTPNPAWIRGRDEIASWFAGFKPVEPGLVHLTDWRPSHDPQQLEVETDVRRYCWGIVGEV
ncbi:SAM-dependent methyltransferase [Saccharopolyspora rosea]|uniref:SAM-dependent methyltransferase n=1 Tax=Saccharopolyspora rosea TaxID=524884 RepID=A0ABW3G1B5_9PSEU